MKNIFRTVVLLTGLMVAPVHAQDETRPQAELIAAGDYAAAEQGLLTRLAAHPEDPYALLNLAYVYQKQGETDRAADIYRRILELKENPYAELASGESVRIKSVARRGMDVVENP